MKVNNQIQLVLRKDVISLLLACVRDSHPNEACGLIFGRINELTNINDDGYKYKFISSTFKSFDSDNKSIVAFLMKDEEKLYTILKNNIKNEVRLISIFHSHPGRAYPSKKDINSMIFLDKCGIKTFKNQIWTIMNAKTKYIKGYLYFQKKLYRVKVKNC